MVEESVSMVITGIGFILVLGLMIESRIKLNRAIFEVQEQLDLLERGVEVVATVLQRLPELVPQFSINQSPLAQILEFFQGIQEPAEGSYHDNQLRDDTGRFVDGSEESEESTTP